MIKREFQDKGEIDLYIENAIKNKNNKLQFVK